MRYNKLNPVSIPDEYQVWKHQNNPGSKPGAMANGEMVYERLVSLVSQECRDVQVINTRVWCEHIRGLRIFLFAK